MSIDDYNYVHYWGSSLINRKRNRNSGMELLVYVNISMKCFKKTSPIKKFKEPKISFFLHFFNNFHQLTIEYLVEGRIFIIKKYFESKSINNV